MLIKKAQKIASSEITPKDVYLNRRKFLMGVSAMAGAAAMGGVGLEMASPKQVALANAKIDGIRKSPLSTTGEKLTAFDKITNYNNYYEFSTDKYEPAGLSKDFKTRPWTVNKRYRRDPPMRPGRVPSAIPVRISVTSAVK